MIPQRIVTFDTILCVAYLFSFSRKFQNLNFYYFCYFSFFGKLEKKNFLIIQINKFKVLKLSLFTLNQKIDLQSFLIQN